MRPFPLALAAALVVVSCADDGARKARLEQEGRDGFQEQRLEALEARLEALERSARQYAASAPSTAVQREAAPMEDPPEETTVGRERVTPAPNAVDLFDVTARGVESNSSWTRFAWQATLRNNLAQPISVKVKVKFLDVDGFVLDEASERVALGPGEERTVRDFDLIDAGVAPRVAKVAGELER